MKVSWTSHNSHMLICKCIMCACIALKLIVARLIYNIDLSEKLNCNSISRHIIYQQTYLQLGTDHFGKQYKSQWVSTFQGFCFWLSLPWPKAINWGHENLLPATLKSKTSHAAWITTLIIFLYKAQLTTNG